MLDAFYIGSSMYISALAMLIGCIDIRWNFLCIFGSILTFVTYITFSFYSFLSLELYISAFFLLLYWCYFARITSRNGRVSFLASKKISTLLDE